MEDNVYERETTDGGQTGILAPPVIKEAPPPIVPPPAIGAKAKKQAPWIVTATLFALAKLKTFGLLIVSGLKYLKIGKVLLTSGSMLLSIAMYSIAFGWQFAAGFVLCIFVHEMGHVFVAWRQKLPISAPVFIPFMGAVIFNKRGSKTAWAQSIMGIGGPVAGTLAGLACWGIFYATGNPFFLALAYVTFFINLFNLTPMAPLDGGWIVTAISPYLWLGGLAILLWMALTGSLRNPLVYVLVLLAVPQLWGMLRYKRTPFGLEPANGSQRWIMGVSYLGLAGFLFACMQATNIERFVQSQSSDHQVAMRMGRGD